MNWFLDWGFPLILMVVVAPLMVWAGVRANRAGATLWLRSTAMSLPPYEPRWIPQIRVPILGVGWVWRTHDMNWDHTDSGWALRRTAAERKATQAALDLEAGCTARFNAYLDGVIRDAIDAQVTKAAIGDPDVERPGPMGILDFEPPPPLPDPPGTPQHMLHLGVDGGYAEWRLECLHDPYDETWFPRDEATSEIDSSGECWTIDWFDNTELNAIRNLTEPMTFPMVVRCWWDDALMIEPTDA